MNLIDELKLHVGALLAAVERDLDFFSSILHYVRRFKELLNSRREDVSQKEVLLLASKIEEFFDQYRPSGEGFYIPPSQTSNTDSTVKEIFKLAQEINRLEGDDFEEYFPASTAVSTAKGRRSTPASPCVFISF